MVKGIEDQKLMSKETVDDVGTNKMLEDSEFRISRMGNIETYVERNFEIIYVSLDLANE